MDAVRLSNVEWRERLNACGQDFVLAAAAGDFSNYLYRPGADDMQGAHSRAEVYFVISGEGTFESGLLKTGFRFGDALFVPAGEAHSFTGKHDVLVWAAFFGAPIDGVWTETQGGDDAATLEVTLAKTTPAARVWSVRWNDSAGPVYGLGLVVGAHMTCARLPAGVDGGVVAYSRGKDGSLQATWAHNKAESIRPGSGTAQPGDDVTDGFEGSYNIQYIGSEGEESGPLWQLDIAQNGERFDLTWLAGEAHLVGTGTMRGDRLCAVWGSVANAENLRLSVLDLPVAGAEGNIHEHALDPLNPDTVVRTWSRDT